MPSIFDLHTVTALQEGWAAIAASVDLFKLHFTDEQISDTLLEEWHASLVARGVEIRIGWTLNPPKTPIVGVTFDDEPADEQLLGNYGRSDGTNITYTMLARQTVTIRSWAHNAELSRVLRVLLRNIMLSYTEYFTGLGYAEVYYLGGGDLRPEDALTVEELGHWVQAQRWVTIGETSVTTLDAVDHKPILVAAEDTVVDGNRGGVSPWEQ